MKPFVHFFGGQGIGWALDEDLLQARRSLGTSVRAGGFARSPIIHSAWWPPLLSVGRRALQGKSVVCFADNPPAFYLTQPGFEAAAARVDLWVARSREAMGQFRELGLPVKYAPYTIDPGVFHPLPPAGRRAIRQSLGFEERDFVVGNFHRDSLGRDLSVPKAQKGPDLFVSVVEEARKRVPSLKVLLAGPRRHWLRGELSRRKIPFVFCGKTLEGDDISKNTLPRAELNRLYAALDCVLISSRWEGGPYAVLEGLFSGRPVVSTPVGMAADLLEGWVSSSPDDAAGLIARIASDAPDFTALRNVALETHCSGRLAAALIEAYSGFPAGPEPAGRLVGAFLAGSLARICSKFREPPGMNFRVRDVMGRLQNGISGPERVLGAAAEIVRAGRFI